MRIYPKISGFADEISQSFDEQLRVVTGLGMKYICIRSAERKGIADYSPEEVQTVLLPKLRAAGVGVSSLGSALGKIGIDDEAAYEKQTEQLLGLCGTAKLLDCRYIRIFSFYPPKDTDPDAIADRVLEKLRKWIAIAQENDVVLIHENEKGIYGDTGARCRRLFDALACPHFGAAFDFANFVQCGEDPAACWELLHEQIAYIHIKDALPGCLLNVVAGTGDGKIPQLLGRALTEEQYDGFLTLEPHLAMFDFFAPGAKGGESRKVQFENNPLMQKLQAEMAEPGRPQSGEEAYAQQYHALLQILEGISMH